MKQIPTESTLIRLLRIYIIIAGIFIPLTRYFYDPALNIQPSNKFTPLLPAVVFLLIYTSFPVWQRWLGWAYLPIAIFSIAAQAIFGNYLLLFRDVSPDSQPLVAVVLMLRLWINFQFLVIVVALRYNMFWVTASSVGLCLFDSALASQYIPADSEMYPIYLIIVVARLVSVTGIGLCLAWLANRQREQHQALAEANQKLVNYATTAEQLAISQERNRLARELHDTLAHSLSGTTVQLEAVQALWDVEPHKARQILNQALDVTQNGLTEARRALRDLRASPLEDLGLALAIKHMAESVASRTGMRLEMNVQNHIQNLTADMEQCIYRVAQESLTNIVRHADANTLHISLQHDSESLALSIADNGRGFDTTTINNSRYGLRGLQERAEMIGATLQIKSEIQKGTTIQLIVPFNKERKT